MGVHALGHDLERAGREAHRQPGRPAQANSARAWRSSLEGTTTTALIGGPGDNTGVGAAWVFTRASTTWSAQGAKLTGSGEAGAGEFGTSVALSLDGTTMTALMGGPGDNSGIGAAWAFTRAGSTWTQQGEKLIGKGEVGAGESTGGKGEFGYSVALSSDGNTALIGGPRRQLGERRRGVGVHALGHDLDPAGRKAHRQRRDRRQANSARAWRSPPTATPR